MAEFVAQMVREVLQGEAEPREAWAALEAWALKEGIPLSELRPLYEAEVALMVERRPRIWINDDIGDMADDGETALMARFPPGSPRAVYQRGGKLVHVIPGDESPQVVALLSTTLKEQLMASATWLTKDAKPTHPQKMAVATLLHRGEWPKIPVLDLVIQQPLMRSDGLMSLEPGYDAPTRSLSVFDLRDYADLAQEISEPEAREALQMLRKPLEGFPFLTDHDRTAALSLVLTLLARPGIKGDVPCYAVRAKSRTGKGLLVKALFLMGTGKSYGAYSPPVNRYDDRERIKDLAKRGERVFFIDNIETSFGSPALASAITAGTIGSTSGRLPWRAVTVATGSTKFGFQSDLGGRTIPVDMRSGWEYPEDRPPTTFAWAGPDLLEHVRANKRAYMRAGFKVLLWHLRTGAKRVVDSGFGGFEGWDSVVRQALVRLGEPDPLVTRDRIRKQLSLLEQQRRRLFVAWHKYLPYPVTVKQILNRYRNQHVIAAIKAMLDDKRTLNGRTLCELIKKHKGRPVDGLVLLQIGHSYGQRVLWQVRPALERKGGL